MLFRHFCRLCGKAVGISEAFAKSVHRTGGTSIVCSACLIHEKPQPLSFGLSREVEVIPIVSKILFLVIIPFFIISALLHFSSFMV